MEQEEVPRDKRRGGSTKEEMARRFWEEIQTNRVAPKEPRQPKEKEKNK